jgi:tryptophan-rich sensory protein
MFTVKRAKIMVIISGIFYIGMIGSNILANLIPINGITTGAISDSYFNLFAPIGLTFSIWGVIYFLTGMYQTLQVTSLNNIKNNPKSKLEYKVNIGFALSSLFNTFWIFLWHYRLILLSLITIVIMLFALGYISIILKNKQDFIKTTFGIYFGWITIATVANITIWLVSIGVPNNTVGANIQTSLIVIVASIIGATTTILQKDIGYGLVILWALLGIYLKHISPVFFDYGYTAVINSTLLGFFIVLIAVGIAFYRMFKSSLKKVAA